MLGKFKEALKDLKTVRVGCVLQQQLGNKKLNVSSFF
jgi:hypothetical protein